ncbi:putative thioredoxin-like protein [Medicago truncatula]|uniref:Putative thioredoxin-like protein n=1 Tax=Medicago truncatula TaxID=3880 RepID=A0A396HAY8_MEDTR|nr:putative thioredoxin-like protein [Medicago truncatula]
MCKNYRSSPGDRPGSLHGGTAHVCGPVLIDKLNEDIQLRGLKDQISVMACSHIGGHKYAGTYLF